LAQSILAQAVCFEPPLTANQGTMPLHIQEVDEEPQGQAFVFHHLPEAQFQSFGNKDIQPLLDKWGFGPDMFMCTFRVEQQVSQDEMQAMLDAFFHRPACALCVAPPVADAGPLPREGTGQVGANEYEGYQHVLLQQV